MISYQWHRDVHGLLYLLYLQIYDYQQKHRQNQMLNLALYISNNSNNESFSQCDNIHTHNVTQNHLMALCLGLPGWAGTRKVKPIRILLKQETVSGSGISWAMCKSAPCSRQITMPAPHHSVFYRPDALPAAQPTASKPKCENIPVIKIWPQLNIYVWQ